jgi:hypothetical protein
MFVDASALGGYRRCLVEGGGFVPVQSLVWPLSVIAAGGLVALAVVFAAPGVPAPAREPSAVMTMPPVTPPVAPPTAAPPVTVAPSDMPTITARGAENARAALEAWRATFVDRCWTPAAARQSAPERLPLQFNLSFSPTGELVGVGIVEDRVIGRADVAACLRAIELQLKIPAPGVVLSVEVPFTLP